MLINLFPRLIPRFKWITVLFCLSLAYPIAIAQAQTPSTDTPLLNQDRIPLDRLDSPELPTPEPQPEAPPDPEEILRDRPDESVPTLPDGSNEQAIVVTDFNITGNTVLSETKLRSALPKKWPNRAFSLAELLSIASRVTDLYSEAGYHTSGARIVIPIETQTTGTGPIEIQIVEGLVETITIIPLGRQRLRSSYLRSRLGAREGEPLNVDRLLERLQLLQLNPLIDQISAELNASPTPGQSLLTVQVDEAPAFSTPISLDNGRSPSVGSFQRQAAIGHANLLGFGDRISIGYSNSDGSDSLTASYAIPINPQDGTLTLSTSRSKNDVIEPPFDDIDQDGNTPDIESESVTYELSFRQSLIREIRERTFQEFAISLAASYRESQSFLFDEPFPFALGVEPDGETRVFALRLAQDWTLQDAQQVIALRSQFNLGLNAFNATVTEPLPILGSDDSLALPDGEFFSWQGQAQWARVLGPDVLFLVRANTQLSNRPLLSSEQFSIGGLGSVRGYRQDQLLVDNGFFASAELQLPVLRIPQWESTLQVIPFFDLGTGWNHAEGERLSTPTLSSLGLGLQWRTSDFLSARLDWGIPLVDVESSDRTWQENGIYFTILLNPF